MCDVCDIQDVEVEGSKRPVCHTKVGASRLCKSGSSKLSEGGDFRVQQHSKGQGLPQTPTSLKYCDPRAVNN